MSIHFLGATRRKQRAVHCVFNENSSTFYITPYFFNTNLPNYSNAMRPADMVAIRVIRGEKNKHTRPTFDKFERFVIKNSAQHAGLLFPFSISHSVIHGRVCPVRYKGFYLLKFKIINFSCFFGPLCFCFCFIKNRASI